MSPDLQTDLQTDLQKKRGRKKGDSIIPLSEQTFGHQLIRLEKLLRNCGNKDRQKLLLDTLSQSYQ